MRRVCVVMLGVLMALVSSTTANAAEPQIIATLDGQPMAAARVPDYACHDLEFPILRCFRKASDRDASVGRQVGPQGAASAAAVIYVTAWDGTGYMGSSISISQNYDALATIGWNDRVGSFKGRNSETGRFNTDWFGGGSAWNFCCNQQTPNLGGYDNTFSSVYRT